MQVTLRCFSGKEAAKANAILDQIHLLISLIWKRWFLLDILPWRILKMVYKSNEYTSSQFEYLQLAITNILDIFKDEFVPWLK